MNNELIINSSPSEVVTAVLSDKRLTDLIRQRKDARFSVGDIYLGKVSKIASSLNAAFINVGYEKDAFLHYFDLGPQFSSLNNYTQGVTSGKLKQSNLMYFKMLNDIPKTGKISDHISGGQSILVQIAKEPISTKGPRITANITLAGRFLILIPFSEKIAISQKIRTSEERERLRKLLESIKPKGFGLIVRTVAEEKSVEEIDADLNDLVSKWDECFKNLTTAKAPLKVLGEMKRTTVAIRDMVNGSFSNITVNDQALFEETKKYVHTIAPEKDDIVKLYKGSAPIFDHFGVEKQLKALFGRTVGLPSGAYLIVEHTEALHVIDINSGTRIKSKNDQETNALDVNMEAAEEVARQLRLRDLGGIIVVDFIDMYKPENRSTLFKKLKEEMKTDKAKHHILPPSKFGLIQITRERVRPQTVVDTMEKCPTCGGTGEVEPSLLFTDKVENTLRFIINGQNEKNVTLLVHPFVYAYLNKGFLWSLKNNWKRKYKNGLKIEELDSLQYLEFKIVNKNGEEIKLS
jgi:ribonuclease G